MERRYGHYGQAERYYYCRNGSGGVSAAEAGTDYQAPLTIATAPASGGTNPISSGGVYNAVKRTDAIDAANTDYGTKMARAIYAGTTDMEAGVTSLTSGVVYMMYEETT